MKNDKNYLKNLRRLFDYYADGTPKIHSYGVFRSGVTSSEIKEYLQVRLNKLNIKNVKKKLDKEFCGSTCPVATFNSQQVLLYYRHDVERFANKVINGTKTYFD